jgi:2-polyprenyl-3-methyl-5-hydroxy-6-metoxy-1,4-benzoquinol methylase
MKKIVIPNLPLYWRVKDEPHIGSPVPFRQDFEFAFDPELRLLKQRIDEKLLDQMETVYTQDANIGHRQPDNPLGDPYTRDLLQYIEKSIERHGQGRIRDVLEIGCGGCVILSHLKKAGMKVKGVDPTPLAAAEGERLGVDVVQDFFPSSEIKGRFDLIFCADVIEHIPDPLAFLVSARESLSDGRLLIIGTPDATESINLGDVSMIIHQHLHYFDAESLPLLMEKAGYEVLSIEKSKWGGNLYALARPAARNTYVPVPDESKFLEFEKRFSRVKDHMGERFEKLRQQASFGLYVPLRAFPYLCICGMESGFRLFDDTPYWHKRFIDGMDVEIENRSDLKENPVDEVLLMSLSFADIIDQKIKQEIGTQIKTVKLRELLEV